MDNRRGLCLDAMTDNFVAKLAIRIIGRPAWYVPGKQKVVKYIIRIPSKSTNQGQLAQDYGLSEVVGTHIVDRELSVEATVFRPF